jgi:hypothetical protein
MLEQNYHSVSVVMLFYPSDMQVIFIWKVIYSTGDNMFFLVVDEQAMQMNEQDSLHQLRGEVRS